MSSPLLHVRAGGSHWLDWALDLDVLALCVVLAYGYFLAVAVWRPRISDAGRVKRSQAALFYLGVVVLYLTSGGPLHKLSDEYLVSAHMLQHTLLMMVVAPLFLAGTPGWLWMALIRRFHAMRVARVVTKPLVALAAFNAVLLLTHLPSAIGLQVQEAWFHLFVHTTQVAAGMLLWWPVLSQTPELPRASYPVQIGYLFLQSLLPAVLASFVTFADSAVYTVYADAPRIWGISPVTDQQIGGGLMKVVGSLVLWTFMGLAFFRWYQQERAEEEEPRWSDVQRELDSMGLAKPR